MKTFLYLHCADLESARRFYSNVLGLKETYFSAEEGTVGYVAGALQISIATHAAAVEASGWAEQLGWEGGATAAPSWGFELAPDEFRRAVRSAREAGTEPHFDAPRWLGYWSFPVRDPMGNTVEISSPSQGAWLP